MMYYCTTVLTHVHAIKYVVKNVLIYMFRYAWCILSSGNAHSRMVCTRQGDLFRRHKRIEMTRIQIISEYYKQEDVQTFLGKGGVGDFYLLSYKIFSIFVQSFAISTGYFNN